MGEEDDEGEDDSAVDDEGVLEVEDDGFSSDLVDVRFALS